MDSWTKHGNLRPISQLALVVSKVKPTQVSITKKCSTMEPSWIVNMFR